MATKHHQPQAVQMRLSCKYHSCFCKGLRLAHHTQRDSVMGAWVQVRPARRRSCVWAALVAVLLYVLALYIPLTADFLVAHRLSLPHFYSRTISQPYWRRYPPLEMQKKAHQSDHLVMERWYGNASQVGRSPYDFVPRQLRPGERKFRLLFLLDFKDYLERMNSHSYEL